MIYEESSSRKRNATTSRMKNALGCPSPSLYCEEGKKEKPLRLMNNNPQDKEMNVRPQRTPNHNISLGDERVVVCILWHRLDGLRSTVSTRNRPYLDHFISEPKTMWRKSSVKCWPVGSHHQEHPVLSARLSCIEEAKSFQAGGLFRQPTML